MGGAAIYRTLSPKLELTDDPTYERCLGKDESAIHILCDSEAIAYLRFRHLGQFLWKKVTTMTPSYTKSYISLEV
jgi:hypothetical protein